MTNFDTWFDNLPSTCKNCQHCIPVNAEESATLATFDRSAQALCSVTYNTLLNADVECAENVENDAQMCHIYNPIRYIMESALTDIDNHTCENYEIDDFKVDLLWQEEIEKQIDYQQYLHEIR